MDLADLKNSPEIRESTTYKFFLVVVNAFDRFTYARNLRTKEPKEVREALGSIIASLPAKKKIRVLASDNGNEFNGPVADLLLDKGIAHRLKPVGDVNALGLVDRTIQSLKRKLAELSATTKRTWPDLLQQAVSALNSTPKPGVLHGDSPAEVKDDPEVQFLLQQDQAKNFRHNARLTEQRQARLESDGAFRAPLRAARASSSGASGPLTARPCGRRASAAASSPPRTGAAMHSSRSEPYPWTPAGRTPASRRTPRARLVNGRRVHRSWMCWPRCSRARTGSR
jgi:hypothetical protein